MKVKFIIYRPGGVTITEDQLTGVDLKYGNFFNEYHSCEGALLIDIDDQQYRLEDELPALVINLCFGLNAINGMNMASYVYYFQDAEDELHISITGNTAVLKSLEFNNISFPADELIGELHSCGLRILEFLKRLECEDAVKNGYLQNLVTELSISAGNKEGDN